MKPGDLWNAHVMKKIKTSGSFKGKSNKLGGGGRFAQVAAQAGGGAKGAAIAAAAGRRKYGAAKMARMAAAGKKHKKMPNDHDADDKKKKKLDPMAFGTKNMSQRDVMQRAMTKSGSQAPKMPFPIKVNNLHKKKAK